MITSPKTALAAIVTTSIGTSSAFTPQSFLQSRAAVGPLHATVDPSTVTKKEYQDICGVDFDDDTLGDRLARTAYLYPKHVEVIDDFTPMVDRMVDEIVSIYIISFHTSWDVSFATRVFVVVRGEGPYDIIICVWIAKNFYFGCTRAKHSLGAWPFFQALTLQSPSGQLGINGRGYSLWCFESGGGNSSPELSLP